MGFSKRQWLVTGSLTAACFGIYFGLRALPVEACEILHYGDYITEEGAIEGCGFEETGFFDLDEMRYPVIARLDALGPLVPGRPTLFTLQLHTSTGRPIGRQDVAISHTERVHAMIVDAALEDYQHVHPQPAGAPGLWSFEMTPRASGEYRVYLDFIPLRTARRTLVQTSFEVPGEAAGSFVSIETDRSPSSLAVRLVPEEETLRADEDISFRLEVSPREAGRALRFDPVMDSYAHLVAFVPGRNGFAHFHPRNPFLEGQDPQAPDLDFLFSVDRPGTYRVWAQFSVNGEEHFVPFDLEVAAAG